MNVSLYMRLPERISLTTLLGIVAVLAFGGPPLYGWLVDNRHNIPWGIGHLLSRRHSLAGSLFAAISVGLVASWLRLRAGTPDPHRALMKVIFYFCLLALIVSVWKAIVS